MTTLEKVGARIYFRGNTFPLKDAIRSLGGHWDAGGKAWWIGAKKEAAARALLADAALPREVAADKAEEEGRDEDAAALRASPPAENLDGKRVYAQIEYKGRRYYVIAEMADLTRCRLATLDGMAPFWADCSACNLIRRYEGRQAWDGRRYSGKTVTRYSTIGSLRSFRDRQKNPDTARVQCPECDAWHDAGEDCRECGGC